MLNDEQLEIISESLVPLFDYLEHEIICDIARRVKGAMMYTRTAELQAMEMRALGFAPAKIRAEVNKLLRSDKEFQKVVEKNTLEYKKAVKELIADIVKKAQEEGNKIVANAGEMSWIDDMRVWNDNGENISKDYLSSMVKAYQDQIKDEFFNLSGTTAFKSISGTESVANAFRMELNKAIIKLSSGTFSQEKVITDTIHSLAQSGLRTIDYSSGRTLQLDSEVRLCIRTGCHQISGEIQKQNIEDTGVNLVYVSEHANARNKGEGIENHEEWQGKVYYIHKADYSEEAKRIGQDEIKDLWQETGYSLTDEHISNPLGLYGYNCRHRTHPWWEGASILPRRIEKKPSIHYNGKELDGYAQTQEMRRQERAIRNMKREREALNTLKMPTAEIDAKIKNATKTYREFCALCGVPMSYTHLEYECGTSDLSKTDAWKRYANLNDNLK